MMSRTVLIDAREFAHERLTGIARVLEGLIDALSVHQPATTILLAACNPVYIPSQFRHQNGIQIEQLPKSFLSAEKRLSDLSKRSDIFISPYPKLPLFGVECHAVNIIHDVLDLTHPLYKRRPRILFDKYRLKNALHRADLTWYDSVWSLKETRKLAGNVGKRPKVRYPGIDAAFSAEKTDNDAGALKKYHLEPGYVIAVGNGLPHKNLAVLLDAADQISRKMVFVGVREKDQLYWKSQCQKESATWIAHVQDGDLPSLLRGAFCLAQPSTAEGYGYPPLEAMACGVPAVVSNIPVLLETTGSIALYPDPHNPRAWIESLNALERDEVRRAQVQKSLEWVEPLKGANGWTGHISDIAALLNERN
jgi:glycosyltransferase involved in cell wall biosynthesis